MSRGLWFVAGAGAGIYAVIRGKRAAEALTVDGMTDRIKGAQVGLQMFREEVAAGKVEKETELRERFSTGRTLSRPQAIQQPVQAAHPELEEGKH